MFSVVSVDRVTRLLKAVGCFLIAAYILRTAYRLPPANGADILPELVCVMTSFVLGLTALAIVFNRPDLPYGSPND